MSNLSTFRKLLVKIYKKPVDYVYGWMLYGYVIWMIKSENIRSEAEEFVYKMNEKMKD